VDVRHSVSTIAKATSLPRSVAILMLLVKKKCDAYIVASPTLHMWHPCVQTATYYKHVSYQGRSDGGYIGIYTPKKSVYLKKMWLFFSCDPGQIRYDICSRVGH